MHDENLVPEEQADEQTEIERQRMFDTAGWSNATEREVLAAISGLLPPVGLPVRHFPAREWHGASILRMRPR